MMHKSIVAIAVLAAVLPNLSQAEEPSKSAIEFLRTYAGQSKFGVDKSTRVAVANVPGTKFTVAFIQGDTWCGSGGCTLLVLKSMASSYEVAAQVPTVWGPILFLGASGDGYPEIGVWVQGGGILNGYEAALAPKEGRYPSPSVSGKRIPADAGTILIGKDDRGTALFK